MTNVVLPRVKVCGLTCAADVRAALEAGADALGFVRHAPSPRDLDAAGAAELVELVEASARDVTPVALMVDPSPEEAVRHLERSGARLLQLCGREDPREWSGFETPILRRLAVVPEAEEELERWRGVALGFVLDHPGGPGGTGRTVDLVRAARLASLAPCLLAGGLAADNVAQRVAAVGPAGVDASSRLESRPGLKDPGAVGAFVTAARRALAGRDGGGREGG